MTEYKKNCLIVDGNSLLNREYYGVRPLKTKGGIYTHAIYGFTGKLLRLLEDFNPVRAVVAYDLKTPTFRHKEFEGYKASRKGMPDELYMQLPYSKEMAAALGFNVVTCEGYEADDIIGTVAKMSETAGEHAYIVTGDKDAFQLVSDNTTVILLGSREYIYYTKEVIFETYGIEPSKFIDVKALMGDASDEIPGVKGIGEKTALTLIKEHGSIEELYSKLDNGTFNTTPRNKERLLGDRDTAYLSKRLVTICTDVPVSGDFWREERNTAVLSELCSKLELRSIAKRLNLIDNAVVSAGQMSLFPPDDDADYIHTERFIPIRDNLYFLMFNNSDGSIYIGDGENYYRQKYNSLHDIAYLFDGNCKYCVYDTKSIYLNFARAGVKISKAAFAFDLLLAAYVLSPTDSDYSIGKLAYSYLASDPESKLTGIQWMPLLYEKFKSLIHENGQDSMLCDMELPLAFVLADMEMRGFKVDCAGIRAFGAKLEVDIKKYEEEIYSLCGEVFNINSPKQLGEVLFDRLTLPFGKQKKTGYSTNIDVLEKLKPYHPVIQKILDYRSFTKLKATYCDGLIRAVSPETGRLHTNFNQTVTATGRLSSTEPNLHNIPVRTGLGRELRKFFIPQNEEYVLIDADYSQIELRILAHLSGDDTLISAFRDGIDIHALTASQVFGVPLELVTKEMRNNAKAVNFGIIYGISEFSLSEDLKIQITEAKRYIDGYFAKYPKVKTYMDELIADAKKDGYVTTLYGRKRVIPELSSANKNVKSFGERVARNTPIQGTAADIIKLAMLACEKQFAELNLKSRLILQVHDELIIECPNDEIERVTALVKTEMENVAELKAPLIADVSHGKSWYEAH